MQGKDFLYFLRNQLRQFYYIDGIGKLQLSANPMPLIFTPDLWQELSILTEKNKKYFGLDRTYGAPSSLVEDAATILKTLFYKKGMEETVNLLILEQQLYFSDTEYGYFYTTLVDCEVDLSTFDHEGPRVGASILEGGIMRAFKANETTEYEIPVDVDAAMPVLLDGLKLGQSAAAIISTEDLLAGSLNRNILLELNIVTSEQKQTLGTKNTTGSFVGYPNDAAIFADKRNFLKTSIDTAVTAAWDFGITATTIGPHPEDKMFLTLRVFTEAGVLVYDPSYILQELDGPANVYGKHQLTGTKTVHIPANCYVFPLIIMSDDVNNNATTRVEIFYVFDFATSDGKQGSPNFTLSYFYTYPVSQINTVSARYVYDQLIYKMTAGKYTGTSTLLDSLDPYVVFTSGDGVRSLKGAVIKISFSDFFGFINMRFGVGVGVINNQLVLEKKAFWVQSTDTVGIGEASLLKFSVYTDCLFSALKVGYPNQSSNIALGDINGKYEFNMTQYYSSPVTRVNTTLDLTTVVQASMYYIEDTRINLDGKTTSDSTADNEVFAISIVPVKVAGQNYYPLDRTINPFAVGLLENQTPFNLRLSPKQCLLANGDYLHSCLDLMENKFLVFNTADQPVNLAVNMPGGQVIEERSNVEISSLPPQIFRPYKMEITIPDRVNLFALSPRKKIVTSYKEGTIQLAGYTLKTGSQPDINAAQVYDLLCSPDTDITQLIDVYE